MVTKPTVVCDVECYPNYFLVGFKNVDTGEVKMFRTQDKLRPVQIQLARDIIRTSRVITFNGRNYDFPMIYYALTGATVAELKDCSDDIIVHGLKFWDVERKRGFKLPRDKVEHWDLIDVAFGKASLKIYGGRIHSKRMQDLPFDPGSILTASQIEELEDYWLNDLQTTIDLYHDMESELALREVMTAEYGIDLMSKSDAQIAEAIIKDGLAKRGINAYRPEGRRGDKFKYVAPPWLRFQSDKLNEVLRRVTTVDYVVSEKGAVELPPSLEGLLVSVGNGAYRMGIGGLHSSEEKVTHYADENIMLVDRDVTSYYPSIILGLGLYPDHLTAEFLNIYREIYMRRLAAKAAGDKVVADTLKIVLNGSFGKFGSKWSILYSPELLIQVTLTGQLALLMLIEMIEGIHPDISVVSANTDGIVIKCPRDKEKFVNSVVAMWEEVTGFGTEATEYVALHSRDVNAYIAVKPNLDVKTKGPFGFDGLHKNPQNMVCNDAAINYLLYGIEPEHTVRACNDVRRYISIRQVKGGAVTDQGEYLGKAVRWYHSTDQPPGCIKYMENGNLVPDTEGCKPLMELPELVPADLDYEWYVVNSHKILKELGL